LKQQPVPMGRKPCWRRFNGNARPRPRPSVPCPPKHAGFRVRRAPKLRSIIAPPAFPAWRAAWIAKLGRGAFVCGRTIFTLVGRPCESNSPSKAQAETGAAEALLFCRVDIEHGLQLSAAHRGADDSPCAPSRFRHGSGPHSSTVVRCRQLPGSGRPSRPYYARLPWCLQNS